MDLQRDNSTCIKKMALRRRAVAMLDNPVVMETHGGAGKLFLACYTHVENGVVFEKNPEKSAVLGKQRPTWAVYEADCVHALSANCGAHLDVNLLDLDPYGEPWSAITAFFESDRPRSDKLVVVVNDGLRQAIRMGRACLTDVVARYGNDIHGKYLDVCAELLQEKAAQAGYSLRNFAGYYCGHASQMTHYIGVLTR